MQKAGRFASEKGAFPLILILLILFLLSSGLGIAIVKLMEPKTQQNLKEAQVEYEKATKNTRTGDAVLTLTLSSFSAGQNTLEISYNREAISGTVTIANQGVTVPLYVTGSINATTGVIKDGQASGDSNVNFPKGMVSARITGTFNGVVESSGKASGTLILSQTITNITGNVPQLSVGQSTSLPTIAWQGTAVAK